MSKLLKSTLVLALAVVSFGAYRFGAAQETASIKGGFSVQPPTFDVNIPDVTSLKHVLQGTYYNNGNYLAAVPASTYTPIDTQLTVACPGTTGTCTIQADMWIENGNVSTSGNLNQVCVYVDGNPAPNACAWSTGQTPSDGTFVNTSASDSISGVTHGNHTVQTYFISANGAWITYYNSTYRVYKP